MVDLYYFGAKIQIIQVNVALKNPKKSLMFSSKIQINNFVFFQKIELFGHSLVFCNSV